MPSNEFEGKFSDFLDSDASELAGRTLFSLLRMAYGAGWEAAGGKLGAEGEECHPRDLLDFSDM